MRMLMKVGIPTKAGNDGIKSESLPKLMDSFLKDHKPEAAYFTLENGRRTALFFLDVKDSTMMPTLAEPFFMTLDADVTWTPVMNPEDLRTGLSKFMSRK